MDIDPAEQAKLHKSLMQEIVDEKAVKDNLKHRHDELCEQINQVEKRIHSHDKEIQEVLYSMLQKWHPNAELNGLLDEENTEIKRQNSLIKQAIKKSQESSESESDNLSRGFTSMFRGYKGVNQSSIDFETDKDRIKSS